MKTVWLAVVAGCSSKTDPAAETVVAPQPVISVPVTPTTPPALVVQAPVAPPEPVEPPLEGTPEWTLNFDKQNDKPPGTYWRGIVEKNDDRKIAEQQSGIDHQMVIDQQRLEAQRKENEAAQERFKRVEELRRQQEEVRRSNPDINGDQTEVDRRDRDIQRRIDEVQSH